MFTINLQRINDIKPKISVLERCEIHYQYSKIVIIKKKQCPICRLRWGYRAPIDGNFCASCTTKLGLVRYCSLLFIPDLFFIKQYYRHLPEGGTLLASYSTHNNSNVALFMPNHLQTQ